MHEPEQKPDEIDEKIWDLLGKATSVEPSAFFSRNVVRSVRNEGSRESGFVAFWKFLFRPQIALPGLALLAGLVLVPFFLKGGNNSIAQDQVIVADSEIFFASASENGVVAEPAVLISDEMAGLDRFEQLLESDDVSELGDEELALLFVGL